MFLAFYSCFRWFNGTTWTIWNYWLKSLFGFSKYFIIIFWYYSSLHLFVALSKINTNTSVVWCLIFMLFILFSQHFSYFSSMSYEDSSNLSFKFCSHFLSFKKFFLFLFIPFWQYLSFQPRPPPIRFNHFLTL